MEIEPETALGEQKLSENMKAIHVRKIEGDERFKGAGVIHWK